jgi:RHS repeat-associated protein
MTRIPRVAAPSSNYLLTFDAWNRVVKIESGAGSPVPIGDYAYDGLHRRVSRTMYVSGSIDFSRRMYYSDNWQVIEEHQYEEEAWLLHKQFVWGTRYVDELIIRDQDTSNPIDGTLNQRHYALQDANFNVVAIVNAGNVTRRFSYDAYGHSSTLNADFTPGAYEYDFEYRYAGYRWDYETHLLQVRNRWYHPRLGRWLSRDPIGYVDGMSLYEYVSGMPISLLDSFGRASFPPYPGYSYPTMDFSRWKGPVGTTCAGTFCLEDRGVTTFINTNRNKSCDHPCKKFLWEIHEGEHRKNMEGCCNAFRECLALAKESGRLLGPVDQRKHESVCREGWSNWRAANEFALEQRAAAVTIKAATNALTIIESGRVSVPIPPSCRASLKGEIATHKPHANANAKLEGCPFDSSGEVIGRGEQFLRLRELGEAARRRKTEALKRMEEEREHD